MSATSTGGCVGKGVTTMANEKHPFELDFEDDFSTTGELGYLDGLDGLVDERAYPPAGDAPTPQAGTSPARGGAVFTGAAHDTRSPEERTAELLERMAPHRGTLFAIIAACPTPTPAARVNALVEEIQRDHYSVFDPNTLCVLLEDAGALERVTADGAPLDEAATQPEAEVIDGVEYLRATTPPELHWRATECGRQAVARDDPAARLDRLLREDERYLPVYRVLLKLCAGDGGATTAELASSVYDHELLQEPRLLAAHFTDKLERCGAICWRSRRWHITSTGQAALRGLGHEEA